MKTIVLAALMLLVSLGISQGQNAELPDAPSAVMEAAWAQNTPNTRPVLSYEKPPVKPRGKKKLLALAGVVAFAVAADVYDVRETEKGLKAGVAQEDYTWLVGSHPSARALYARDSLVLGITTTPSVLSYIFHRNELYYGFLSAPVVYGIKHIQGGNQWKNLLQEVGK